MTDRVVLIALALSLVAIVLAGHLAACLTMLVGVVALLTVAAGRRRRATRRRDPWATDHRRWRVDA